jgi:hypothetical protein
MKIALRIACPLVARSLSRHWAAMFGKSKWLWAFAVALFALVSAPARADIAVTFYSHDLGSSFPHAFFTVKGTPDRGGAAVDTNFGFTAKSVSPAILMGSVVGEVESVKPSYIAKSDRRFSIRIDDARYDALMAVVAKWRAIPGKSYDLGTRNCVHFVGEAARAVGLTVAFDKKLMKKPKTFLLNVLRLNPGLD